MKKSDVLAALGALAQENRLDAFRLLVQAGPEGLPAGEVTSVGLAFEPATSRIRPRVVITFYPVHQRLVRKTGRVSLSAFVCSVMVVVAFVIPLLFITAVAMDQFQALGAGLQDESAELARRLASAARSSTHWYPERVWRAGGVSPPVLRQRFLFASR
jgi:hypothetical protein